MYKQSYNRNRRNVRNYDMFKNYDRSYYNTRNRSRNRRRRRRRSNPGKNLLVILVVLLVVGLGIFAAVSVFSPKCDPVTELKATVISDSSLSLSWKGNDTNDGYFVYQRKNEKEDFKKISEINKKSTENYTVKSLKPATEYEFCVTGYKKGDKDPLESAWTVVTSFTRPSAIEFHSIESQDESKLHLKWNAVKGAAQYEVQYEKGTDPEFKSGAQKVSSKNTELTIENLDKNDSYSVRLRYCVNHKEDKVYSVWSESNTVYIAENFTISNQIDPNKPMVALTFDDGPGFNKASDKILDVFEKYKARATFFMVGYNASVHPENIKRKAELGMELGNHTWNHKHYGENVNKNDIKKASDAIYKICGKYPTAFRSPGGMTTTAIKEECKAEKMALYYWSIDTEDWRTRNASSTINSVMNSVSDGDIILMHEIYDQTAVAVEKLVPKLIKAGYQLVTCQELITAKTGKPPEAGVQYISGRLG